MGYYERRSCDDRNIDQDLCRTYEGFYYYRVYDLKADRLLDEWHLQENCKVVNVDMSEEGDGGMSYMVKKEDEEE